MLLFFIWYLFFVPTSDSESLSESSESAAVSSPLYMSSFLEVLLLCLAYVFLLWLDIVVIYADVIILDDILLVIVIVFYFLLYL